ncbi:MAG: restriction endonuclease subunit S, partial [Leptospiraceae bacterium]|nr:restriction endonuclease subunit S [Leptospiraceae bacterium]
TVEEIGIASTCVATVEKATFAGFLIRFRPNANSLDPEFSKYFFRSDIQRKFFVGKMNLVTRASLGQDLLKDHPVFLIPLEEQKRIVQFLDQETDRIDKEISYRENEISLLKEYRQSLITEAVTGKIDVRDYSLT